MKMAAFGARVNTTFKAVVTQLRLRLPNSSQRIFVSLNPFTSLLIFDILKLDFEQASNGGAKMLVLIADDDPDWTHLVSTWVEGETDTRHVTTRTFAEPDLMMKAVSEENDSVSNTVIFLDLDFANKGMNGIDTLRLIKDHEEVRIRNLPVIIYSRSASTEEIDESYANNANSFVHKGKGKQQKEILLDTVRFWMQTAKLPS